MSEVSVAGTDPAFGTAAARAAPAVPRPASRSRLWAGGLSLAGMLSLVSVMAIPRRDGVPKGHVDPQVWWHVGRASGLIAWVLLGLSVAGGMYLSTSLAGRRTRSWTNGVHTFTGVLAVVFTMIHLAAVLAADDLQIRVLHLVVPFTRAGAPLAQAFGVTAWYLLLAVATTSWLRGVLPWRWWRRLHLLAFPLFGCACAHAVLAGSDASHPVLLGLSAAAGLVLLGLFGYRLLLVRRRFVPVPASPVSVSPVPASPVSVSPAPVAAAVVAQPAESDQLTLLVSRVSWEADGVISVVLTAPDRVPLPSWGPGAHVELALPSGRLRHYSLCGNPAGRDSYEIAVLRQDDGRGGSQEIHTQLPVSTRIAVRPPRNNFRLEPAESYLFIAGGIGITAVLPMVHAIAAQGGDWRLLYGGRTRAGMAFIERMRALDQERVEIVPQDECGLLDLSTAIAKLPAAAAVYSCGPPPLLRAITELVQARGDLKLHLERFTGAEPDSGAPVRVELKRSGRVIEVAEHESVLAAVRRALPSVAAGCERGVCGSCRVVVLAGDPQHRDELLSDAERAAGQMLICVSRARGERLTLDL